MTNERGRQASIMAEQRAANREIGPPPEIADPARRAACLEDPREFLRVYFPHIFRWPFTAQHDEMIDAIMHAIEYRSMTAIAASRGEGKTSLARYLAGIYAPVAGLAHVIMLVGPVLSAARKSLDAIRLAWERDAPLLAADFPEYSHPIISLGRSAKRCDQQTCGGEFTYIDWRKDRIAYPTIPGTSARGAIITTASCDTPVRGYNEGGHRVDLAIIDDVDFPGDSAERNDKRLKIINSDIAGLGGRDTNVGRVCLCTLISAHCNATQLTDRDLYPGWQGQRFRFLVERPDKEDLWMKYVEMRREDKRRGDADARRAHQFYLDHREEMDAGAEVANPHSYNRQTTVAGTQAEESALQHYYNQWADNGEDFVRTEYDNDPPDLGGGDLPQITAQLVCDRITGEPWGRVPAGTTLITAGVDCHARHLDYVVTAWQSDRRRVVIDYGRDLVESPQMGNLMDAKHGRAIEMAIIDALRLLAQKLDDGYPDGEGEVYVPDAIAVDTRYKSSAVLAHCREMNTRQGMRRWLPLRGATEGRVSNSYRERHEKPGKRRRIGDGWYAEYSSSAHEWLYHPDSDRFRREVHEAFMTPVGEPNALQLAGESREGHIDYAQEVTSMVWTVQRHPTKGEVGAWLIRRKDGDHLFDATAYADVAAAIRGVTSLPKSRARRKTPAEAIRQKREQKRKESR